MQDALEIVLQGPFKVRNNGKAEGKEKEKADRHGYWVRHPGVEMVDNDVAKLLMDEIERVGGQAGSPGKACATWANRA